jgi:integrase
MPSTKVNLKKIKRQKGYVYQIDYRINGKRIREVVGSDKQTALLKQATVQQDLILGKLRLPNQNRKQISLQALSEEFLSTKRGEVRSTSFKRYDDYLTPFVAFFKGFLPIQAEDARLVEHKHIREFIEYAQSGEVGWSKKTVNGAIKLYRAFFTYAVETTYCDQNPMNKVKEAKLAPGRRDFFSDDELERIWDAVDLHWRSCLEFTAHTGLRKGEMINLTWENVSLDPKDPNITVASSEEWSTKSGRSRTIPLNTRAVEILEAQKGKHATYVFTSRTNKKIHPDEPYHALKKALQKLGLKGDVHKLRHTFASKLRVMNTDIAAIQELLGHADLKTTMLYAHSTGKHLRSAVDKLASRENV